MSLLKRIEQGQAKSSDFSAGNSEQGQAEDGSRLMNLQNRRLGGQATPAQAGTYYDLKTRVQNRLLAELDTSLDVTKTVEVRRTIQDLFEQILTEENIILSRPEK